MKKFLIAFLLISSNAFATTAVREKLPSGVTNFYVNPCGAQTGWSAGNDNNDGLSQSTPKQHYNTMIYAVDNGYDYNSVQQSTVVINGAPNCTDTVGVHYATHALVGAQGGAAMKIKGGTGSAIIPSSGTAVDVFNGSILQLESIKLASSDGAAASVSFGAQLYLLDGVELGDAATGQINISSRGHAMIGGEVLVSGDAFGLIVNSGLGMFDGVGSFKFTDNVTYGGALMYGALNAVSHFGGTTFNLNGHSVTGTRWLSYFNSTVIVPGGNCNTYFPGSTNGGTGFGGQCD